MSTVYECPNTGVMIRVAVAENAILEVISGDLTGHPIPLGLIHRALEREGYTVTIEKPS